MLSSWEQYRDAVDDGEHHEGGHQQQGAVEAGSGRDDVPLPVLLLIGLLHRLVILGVLLQIFVEEKVPVNNTEVIKQ